MEKHSYAGNELCMEQWLFFPSYMAVFQIDSLMNAVYPATMCVVHALYPPLKFIKQQEKF